MRILLTLKAWKLFILFAGIKIAYDILVPLLMDCNSRYCQVIKDARPFISLLSVVVITLWLYGIFSFIHARIGTERRLNPVLFYTVVFLPFAIFMFAIFAGGSTMLTTDVKIIILATAFLIDIGGVFLVARYLASFEKKRMVSFNEYRWYVVLFLFLPLGIWKIQPLLNELVEQDHAS